MTIPATPDRAGAGDGSAETLQARDVSVRFEGLTAIDGVSITLGRNEVLGLIGPNGAGKTTLVNVLTGFERSTEGRLSSPARTSPAGPRTASAAPALRGPFRACGCFAACR